MSREGHLLLMAKKTLSLSKKRGMVNLLYVAFTLLISLPNDSQIWLALDARSRWWTQICYGLFFHPSFQGVMSVLFLYLTPRRIVAIANSRSPFLSGGSQARRRNSNTALHHHPLPTRRCRQRESPNIDKRSEARLVIYFVAHFFFSFAK